MSATGQSIPLPLLAPDQEPQDEPLWPRGSVAYEKLPTRLFEHLVARLVELNPGSTTTLLQVSKQFFDATARALYEEIELADDEGQLARPPRSTQTAALLRHPENYARYVRKLTIGPRSIQAAYCDDTDEHQSSYFSFSPFASSRPLSAEALAQVLDLLPCVETFVWASDRVPRSELCQVLARKVPKLLHLAVRPQPDTQHPVSDHPGIGSPPRPSQEGMLPSPGSESLEHASVTLGPPRWHGQNLHLLPHLKELNLAHISLDGSRYLASALTSLTSLRLLKLDFGFVDDVLLEAVSTTCTRLEHLTIRTSGTKLTANGLAQVMSECRRLRALTLTEVEGRLAKATWAKLKRVPPHLRSLRVAFNEVGHRHSWTCDHLHSLFDVLKLTAADDGQSTLTTFAVSRIVPTVTGGWNLEESFSALGLAYAGPGSPERSEACNPLVSPQPLPTCTLERYGRNLRQLDLTFFSLSIADVRSVLTGCPKLETLSLLVDASFSELLGMHAAFSAIHHLSELNVSLLEAYSATPQLTTRLGDAPTTPGRRRRSSATGPEFSSASSTLSTPSASEPKTPETPVLSLGRRSAKSQSPRGIDKPLGSQDIHVPTARDVRKFARGLGHLHVIRWTGRGGKGEWRLGPEGHGLRTVEFYSASEAVESLRNAMWTSSALEVDDVHRRSSGYVGLGVPRSDSDSGSEEDSNAEEVNDEDGLDTDESDGGGGRSPDRSFGSPQRGRGSKAADRDSAATRTRPSATAASPTMSHTKAASVASSRRSASERALPLQQPVIAATSTGRARRASRSDPTHLLQSIPTSKTFSSSVGGKGAPTSAPPSSERHGVVRRAKDEVGTIIIGHGHGRTAGAVSSPTQQEGSSKSKNRGARTRGKRRKNGEGNEAEQIKKGGAASTSSSSAPSDTARRSSVGALGSSNKSRVEAPPMALPNSGVLKSSEALQGRNGEPHFVVGARRMEREGVAPGSATWSEWRRRTR